MSADGFWKSLWDWFAVPERPPHAPAYPPFPAPSSANAEGLVTVGGPLTARRLLDAYQAGIFPWYNEGMPVLWWSPDPRGVIELDGLHVSRRLARTLRQGKFRTTTNLAFSDVIRACADRAEGTWITTEMLRAYGELHRLGHAHSVETWNGDLLAGGIYGVSIGGLFAGESMFHRETDASKAALVALVQRLKERSFSLLDIQLATPHTRSMGAVELPRTEYLRRLRLALRQRCAFAP